MEFLEPPQLAAGRFCAGGGGGLQGRHMVAQRAGGGKTEDEVHAVSAADVEHLGRAVVAVAADQNLHPGPVGADFTDQTAQMAAISQPLRRLAGRSTAATKRPAPSNTTMGWKPYSS